MQYYTNFAYTYDSGAYGASTYETSAASSASTTTATTTGTTTGANSGGTSGTGTGVLTNTGFDVLVAATLACAIIFAATIVRFWKRPVKVPIE
jgi:hypothetical protein